jgi:hypothetical protein
MDAALKGERRNTGRKLIAVAKAACLVGFPAIPALIYLSGAHPSLPGPTSADQIRQLAEQSVRWTQVHFAFSIAGFLGLATLFILRGLVPSSIPVQIATAIGLIGGVVFTGTVLMEVGVIPDLSLACRSSPGCLSPSNTAFADELANQGWRILPGLTMGGRILMAGLALLSAIALAKGALRFWEAAPLFAGSLIELTLNTGLHAWGNFNPSRGMPGLAAVALLIGGLALSVRLVREAWGDRPGFSTSASTAREVAPAPGDFPTSS